MYNSVTKNKILRKNLTKEVQDSYIEDYKIMIKEIKGNQNK